MTFKTFCLVSISINVKLLNIYKCKSNSTITNIHLFIHPSVFLSSRPQNILCPSFVICQPSSLGHKLPIISCNSNSTITNVHLSVSLFVLKLPFILHPSYLNLHPSSFILRLLSISACFNSNQLGLNKWKYSLSDGCFDVVNNIH